MVLGREQRRKGEGKKLRVNQRYQHTSDYWLCFLYLAAVFGEGLRIERTTVGNAPSLLIQHRHAVMFTFLFAKAAGESLYQTCDRGLVVEKQPFGIRCTTAEPRESTLVPGPKPALLILT